ncbi:TRAP transporter substrate-binding protein DctP [Psychrobacillus sp. BL-248-WT-3]|uniref:TRAP transporter substrate-binding protein n=1 Tax=Psychrobacillus sp. BL-248-WT-3 TaxID=2725306 RepID=UPI00146EEA54|nr:TRAP transporter substrate-binding protein DctP [Psychrobacillus sp. BL-248-WT-3]NME07551.1 TRAP transporter substrate-binding protein DctP [Psychrobacillus sp. BL-248-WT-3]
MKKFLLIVVILLTILGGCSKESDTVAKADNGSKKSQSIKIAYNLPKEHATGVYFEVLAEEIEKKTKDTSIQLIPSTFPNGQLYNDSQLPDAVATGGVQIGQITTGFLAGGEAKPLQITDLPFVFNSWESMWKAEDGEYGTLFNAQFEKLGMKLIGWPSYGTLELYGNKPIKVPKDVSGHIMRGFGQGASLMLQELGASPVSMSSQEIYQALEHGAIDGYTTGPSSVIERSLFEVTKYGTDMTVLYLSFQSATNLDWWESLPEDVQDAVNEASKIAQEKSREEAKEKDLVYKQKLADSGLSLYTPSEEEMILWKEAASNRYKEYMKSSGEIGEKLMQLVEQANEN